MKQMKKANSAISQMNPITQTTTTIKSIGGHLLTGTLASGALAGALNYDKYKKEQMGKNEAITDTIKLGLQGGLATGSAITAADNFSKRDVFGALTAISIGAMGVYAVEKISENFKEAQMKAMMEMRENDEAE